MAIKTRRGSAGEDVTATEQFVEDVVATDEDQSYEVEGTDSPEETVQEATVITDDHEVVNPTEDGEIVDEEIEENREGRRGRRTRRGVRRGSRKGLTYGELRDMLPANGDADEEDRIFKEVGFDDTTEEADVFFRALEGDPGSSYIFEQTIGRAGGRRGSRKGDGEEEDVEEVIMNEDGDTQEVELPEPDEEELEKREGLRGRRTRRGSRKGATLVDGKSPMDYLKMLEELQGFPEEREIIESGDEDAAEEYLKKDAQLNNQSYEEAVRSIAEEYGDDSYLGGRKGSRKGSRRGSRKGNGYGGKSEVHQESIKAAVAVAMRDRRL